MDFTLKDVTLFVLDLFTYFWVFYFMGADLGDRNSDRLLQALLRSPLLQRRRSAADRLRFCVSRV